MNHAITVQSYTLQVATPDGHVAEFDVIGLAMALEVLSNRWQDPPATYIPKVQDHLKQTAGLNLSPSQTWQLVEASQRIWKEAKKNIIDSLNSQLAMASPET